MWIFKRKKRKRNNNIWDNKSMSVSQPNLLHHLSSSSSSSSSSVDLTDNVVQQQQKEKKKKKKESSLLPLPPPLLLCSAPGRGGGGGVGRRSGVEVEEPPQEAAVAAAALQQSTGPCCWSSRGAPDRPRYQSHHKSASLGSACLHEPLMDRARQEEEEDEEDEEEEEEAPASRVRTQVGRKKTLSMGAPGTSGVSPDRALPSSGLYKLEVELKKGLNLAIRDRGGTSDPYVKMKLNGKEVFRSKTVHKNLNPVWDERTTLVIDSLNEPLYLKVFDYDFGLQDDFMGSAYLNLESLEHHRTVPVTLVLRDPQHPAEDLGTLELLVTLSAKHSPVEETTSHTMTMLLRRSWRRSNKQQQSLRLSEFHQKAQLWRGIVSIALIEARDLLPMDTNGLSDPYVKFRLGDQKYRSKTVPKTLSPQWREQFDLHLFEETGEVLEICVWDKDTGRRDDFIGRCELDLSTLAKEQTHHMELPLEDTRGTVVLLVTLTASSHVCIADLQVTPLDDPEERNEILQRYGVWRSLSKWRDVGVVQIKVMRAEGLMAADVNGKSDPFCVLELNNDRLQTHTVYKTLNPEWNKVFTFNVKDIHSVLEVTVYDEDRDRSADFLGKLAIPLLQMHPGAEKAYVLKNKDLTGPTKGVIYLETEVIYNTFKAALHTLAPAEQKYLEEEPKVSKQLLRQNFNRVKKCIMVLINNGTYINSCLEWESAQRSIASFVLFVVVVWNFEMYMLPLALVLMFTWNYLFTCRDQGDLSMEVMFDWEDEDDDKDDKDSERKGLMDKLYAIQDVFISVQSALDDVASYGERIKNTVNWTVPFISWLAIISLCVATVLLYFIPLRYLVLAWGVNKFTKKLRDPYLIDTNELLNFFSRVPSDVQLMHYSELKVEPSSQSPSKRRRPHISS